MINAGTDDGVRIDDIVVCSEGLAGRISDAGRDWAKVTGIVDPSVSVSFCVLRDPSVIGVAKGDGAGGITGYLFDDSDFILESDVLVTSGLGFYPQGIRIAQVDTVHISENTKKKEITAFTEVDFRSVRMVTVLTKDLQR